MRGRRCWVIGSVLVVMTAPAAADTVGFLQLLGGGSVPAADATWSDGQEPGPKVSAGVGLARLVGGMASVDYTFVPVATRSYVFPLYAHHESLRRLRVLGHFVVAPLSADQDMWWSARVGVGVDRVTAEHDLLMAGTYYPYSRTHSALALEIGGGIWFDLPFAHGIDAGAEVAIPIAFHRDPPNYLGQRVGIEYTAVDVDLLVGVRFTSVD